MPIAALLDGEKIIGPLVDDETWEKVKNIAHTEPDRLVMRGTGKQGYPRRSRAGLRHFAHRSGGHATAPESIGHEMIKLAVYQSIQDAGWRADLEVPGPDFQWIADVLATSPAGRDVAFEVQLSGQSKEDTLRRTEKYRRSGVYVVWITPHSYSIPPHVDAIILEPSMTKLKKVDTVEGVAGVRCSIFRNGIGSRNKQGLPVVIKGILGGNTYRASPFDLLEVYAFKCTGCEKLFTLWDSLGHTGYAHIKGGFERGPKVPPLGKESMESMEVREHLQEARRMFSLPKEFAKVDSGPGFRCPHCGKRHDEDDVLLSKLYSRMHYIVPLTTTRKTGNTLWLWETDELFPPRPVLEGEYRRLGGTLQH